MCQVFCSSAYVRASIGPLLRWAELQMASGGCVFRRRHSAVEAGLAPLVLPHEWFEAHASIPNHSETDAARCLRHVYITCYCVIALSYLPSARSAGRHASSFQKTLTDRIEPDVLVGCKICNSAVVCVEMVLSFLLASGPRSSFTSRVRYSFCRIWFLAMRWRLPVAWLGKVCWSLNY